MKAMSCGDCRSAACRRFQRPHRRRPRARRRAGLESLDDGTQGPFRNESFDLRFDEILAGDRLIHGVEIGLKGNLLRGMIEA